MIEDRDTGIRASNEKDLSAMRTVMTPGIIADRPGSRVSPRITGWAVFRGEESIEPIRDERIRCTRYKARIIPRSAVMFGRSLSLRRVAF